MVPGAPWGVLAPPVRAGLSKHPPDLQVPFRLAGAGAADARARPAHSWALGLLPAPLLYSVTCGWGSRPSHLARATPGKLPRFCLDVLTTLMFPASCLVCAHWPLSPRRGSLPGIHEAPDGHALQTSRNAGLMPASHLGHPPGCPRPPGARSLGSRGCGRPLCVSQGWASFSASSQNHALGQFLHILLPNLLPCRDLEKVRKRNPESPPCPRVRSALERFSAWRCPATLGPPLHPPRSGPGAASFTARLIVTLPSGRGPQKEP